jgi:hypothetical protein
VWYWGGRYIPWLARLVVYFWLGSYAAWRLAGISSGGAALVGAAVVLAVITAGELGQFRSRREAVVRREADPRQFDAVEGAGAEQLERALLDLGFARRGDCSSTKGNALVRRRIFVHAERRSIVAALFHTSTIVPAEKGTARTSPEERSVAPTSLSMLSYAMNGTLVRSRSTAPGEKPMRPIPREAVEDNTSAPPQALLDAHARRLELLETRDNLRMIDVNAWSAFALADALDDAWARRLESFAWTPTAYRMLLADYRWFRDLPFVFQAGAVLALIALGPGLFYVTNGASMARTQAARQIEFTPTAMGAHYDASQPPVFPGAVVESSDSATRRRVGTDTLRTYLADAPIETVRLWYENRMPSDATEFSMRDGEMYMFAVQRSSTKSTVVIAQDSPTSTLIDIGLLRSAPSGAR